VLCRRSHCITDRNPTANGLGEWLQSFPEPTLSFIIDSTASYCWPIPFSGRTVPRTGVSAMAVTALPLLAIRKRWQVIVFGRVAQVTKDP
jgi:hypothetical protein